MKYLTYHEPRLAGQLARHNEDFNYLRTLQQYERVSFIIVCQLMFISTKLNVSLAALLVFTTSEQLGNLSASKRNVVTCLNKSLESLLLLSSDIAYIY